MALYGFKSDGTQKGLEVTDSGELKISGSISSGSIVPAVATVSSLTSSLTSSQELLGSDASRLSAIIANDTGVDAFILYGDGTASATNYSLILYDGQSLEVNFAGDMQVVCASGASGRIQITELTAA